MASRLPGPLRHLRVALVRAQRRAARTLAVRAGQWRLRAAERLAPAGVHVVALRNRIGRRPQGSRPSREDGLQRLLEARQDVFGAHLAERFKGVVQTGPFEGIYLGDRSSWSGFAAKLLGVYEQELHAVWERIADRDYERIVVVGCAEGYYALGLARAHPRAQVFACDLDPQARAACENLLRRNGLQERASVRGEVSARDLETLAAGAGRVLLVLDCEGAESTLLDPSEAPNLARCDILVECHDQLVPGVTKLLEERFRASHRIERIEEAGRDPNALPAIAHWHAMDKAIALCEFRTERMHWLFLQPQASP